MATVEAAKSFSIPDQDQTERRRVAGFFALLFLVDCYLYFWNIGHFFQGDSVFLLHNRLTSAAGFLREFVQLHASGWYRPLANEIVESVLFPVLGLNPAGYRIPVYALFFANSIAVYVLAFVITRRRLTAAIAAFFFNIHTTNAYVTYDIAFLPELLYTLFYIGSVLAYLRYVEHDARSALRVSLACFVASLLSKEAAVTLPGVLLALHVLLGLRSESDRKRRRFRDRIVGPLLAIRWHVLTLICYLLFAVGQLHVANISFDTILRPTPATAEPGGYDYTLGKAMLGNADVALTWAFNIPRGWNTGFRHLKPPLISALKIFRVFVLAILVILLFRRERKILLAGAAWFFVTIIPSLPLVNHFMPYYLFLPLVGFSLLIGSVFAFVAGQLGRTPYLATGLVTTILAGLLVVCSVSIHADIRDNALLGGSADLARDSLNDLKRLYPVLPAAAMIYIIDDRAPLGWVQDHGSLIQMAYSTKDVSVLYSADVKQLPPDAPADRVIVLRYDNKHLVDDTAMFRRNPQLTTYKDPEGHGLRLSAGEVTVGDSYSLEISGLQNTSIQIAYSLDQGPTQTFKVRLDHEGRARFNVSSNTPKGSYRFIGFSVIDRPDWFRADGTISVR